MVFTKNIAFGHSKIFLHVSPADNLEDALLIAQAEFEKQGFDVSSMHFVIGNEFPVPDADPFQLVIKEPDAEPVSEKGKLMKRIVENKDRDLLGANRSGFKDHEIEFLEDELKK